MAKLIKLLLAAVLFVSHANSAPQELRKMPSRPIAQLASPQSPADPSEPVTAAPSTAPAPLEADSSPTTTDLSRQFSTTDAASSTPTRSAATSARLAQAPEMFGDSASLISVTGVTMIFRDEGEPPGEIVTVAQIPAGSFGLKVSDNNSPLPRDRVYYRFSNFDELIKLQSSAVSTSTNQTFVTPRSLPVHTVGLEKTFCDGMTSVEVRVPFSERVVIDEEYATDDGNFVHAASFETAGAGNVAVITKVVLTSSDDLLWAGGLGIETPTGRDSEFSFPELQGEYRNKAVYLYPYLAALWTPDEAWFHQAFVGVNIPVSNDEFVVVGTSEFDPVAASAAEVDLPTLMTIDFSSGYWLMQDRDDWCVTDLALFGEFHYTTTLGTPDPTPTPGAAASAGSIDLVNLTGGVHVQLGPRLSLRVSGVLPVADKPFDNELTAQMTYWY